MLLCVRFSWNLISLLKNKMMDMQDTKKAVPGVSHPEDKVAVTLRLNAEDGERLREAAHSTGRSVAGFVRFAALQLANEVLAEA